MMRHIRFASVAAILGIAALIYTLLPPPQSARAQFAGQSTYAGASGGSTNVLTLALANLASYSDIRGVPITFLPSASNTLSATINVNSLGAVTISRPSSIGKVALGGGEIKNGVLSTIMYDGTNFLIVSVLDTTPIGQAINVRGSVAPSGYLIEDGSCYAQATYPALFSVIGTSYGSCTAGNFGVPDSRGTMFAALDNQGVNGSAGRITSGGSGCTATAIGLCGAQTQTLTLAQLPPGIGVTITPGGSFPRIPLSDLPVGSIQVAGAGTTNISPANSNGNWSSVTSLSGTSNNTSGLAHPILPPISLGLRAIKY